MTIHAAPVASPSDSHDELLRRLYGANEREIANIVSDLPPLERARLAFFCYARGHLHSIGFAVAATCDLPFLMQAAPSNAAGQMLFARSRERFIAAIEPMSRRRPAITLAKTAVSSDAIARLVAGMSDDENDFPEPTDLPPVVLAAY